MQYFCVDMSYVNYDYVVEQLREAGLEIELPIELARNEKSVRCRIVGGDHEKEAGTGFMST